MEPLVPLIVSRKVPVGVVVLVLTVMVVEPEVVTEGGLKMPVAPAGKPITPKVTVPVKPPEGVTVAV
jgi:hypothetical protein